MPRTVRRLQPHSWTLSEPAKRNAGAARRIIATLNANDRAALERYLNTEYRQSFNRVKFDYDAMYASASFPSTEPMSVTQKACDSASEMEARATP